MNQGSGKVNALIGFLAIFSAVIYISAVVLGGVLDSHYSHCSQTISELIGKGAPHQNILHPLFLLYNLLVGAFAVGLLTLRNHKKTFLLGSSALVLGAIAGVIMYWFPTDLPGMPITKLGKGHIVLAAIESLCTLLATFLLGWSFKGDSYFGKAFIFTFVMATCILVTGPLTAISFAKKSPFLGVYERFTIGSFIFWLIGLGIFLMSSHPLRKDADTPCTKQ